MHSPLNEELARDRIRARQREAAVYQLADEVWQNRSREVSRPGRAEAARRALGQALISLGARISGLAQAPTPRMARR